MESLIERSAGIEKGIRQILIEKGVVKPEPEAEEIGAGRLLVRQSVAGVLVPPNWHHFLDNPEDMPLLMGIGGIRKNALEFLGGGIMSQEELSLRDVHETGIRRVDPRLLDAQGSLPRHLFYLMEGMYAMMFGKVYEQTFETRKEFIELFQKALRQRVAEEAGDQVERLIRVGDRLPLDPKVSYLPEVGFGPFNDEIVKRWGWKGVAHSEKSPGRLTGFWQQIAEIGFVAEGDLDHLQNIAKVTDDVRGLVQVQVGDLLERGEEAVAGGLKGWNNWNTDTQGFKPRNDSVFYLLRGMLEWMKRLT